MLKLISLLALFLPSMFMFVNHPLSFGILLLLQTLLIALITGTASMNFWFSYIIFLIMVGGMLILFIYMTSVASNEKFKFSPQMMSAFMLMMLTTIIFMIMDPFLLSTKMKNYEMIMKHQPISLSMSKYINLPNNMLMYLTIIYLLISLIMVVKITKVQYGPLRQKF